MGSNKVKYIITTKTSEEFDKWNNAIQELVDSKMHMEYNLENPI